MTYSNSFELFTTSFLHKHINFSSKTLSNLFAIWKKALLSFVSHNLTELDPLVCENSCHIRAAALHDLVLKYQNEAHKLYLHQIIANISNLIHKTCQIEIAEKDFNTSIYDFLLTHELFFTIDKSYLWDFQFIVLSYILTLTKKDMGTRDFTLCEKTCHEKIIEPGLVHNKAKSYVSSAQKELSAMSCAYIQSEVKHLGNDALSHLLHEKKDNHGRSFVAQFPTGKTIVNRALQTSKIIVLKIAQYVHGQYFNTLILAYKCNQNTNEFEQMGSIPYNLPCLVMSGVVNYENHPETTEEYINRLSSHSIANLILANLAAHQQFSGSLKETPCIFNEAITQYSTAPSLLPFIEAEYTHYLQMKQFAHLNGCEINNPSLLFLNHIFCDSTNNYIGDSLSPFVSDNLYPNTNTIEELC